MIYDKLKSFFKINFVIISLLLLIGCSSDGTIVVDNAAAINQIEERIKSGTWRISSYIDSGNSETADYAGYNFTFNENGSLVASKGASIINGTWSVTDDNNQSNDDRNNDDDIDFNISFASPPNFQELSDDWDVVNTNTTKIDLMDISGGNGGTDSLTFTKN